MIKSRIVGHEDVAPDQLLAHPLNFRRHPGSQMDALRGSQKELGYVKSIIVNKRTGYVIDGHARVELALQQGQKTIPVTYVDLSPEEERLALAVLDPITELAYTDPAILEQLLAEVTTSDGALEALIKQMVADSATGSAESPEDFKEVDEDLATDYRCPKCSYEWSGKPK